MTPIPIDWPADKMVLLELAEGIAKIKGQSQGAFLAELLQKELKSWFGGYQLEHWMQLRMEATGLSTKYEPKTEEERRLRANAEQK